MHPVKTLSAVEPGWTAVTFAKDQPEYRQLPAVKAHDGTVICAWQLTWRERLRLALRGRLYLSMLTFNHPLQPVLPMTAPPILHADGWYEEGA